MSTGRGDLMLYPGWSSACICLEEVIGNAEGLVRLRNRSLAFSFQAGERSNRVNVLWNYNALIVDLVYHVRLTISHVEDVFPVSYLPHVSPSSEHVSHHLSYSVHAINSISRPDRCQPRCVLQDFQDILPLRIILQLNHGKVKMTDIERSLRGHCCNIQFG